MKEVVIASACRTAIGAFGGSLKNMNGAALAAVTMKEAVSRAGIDPAVIDDVRYGCCLEHHDTLNITRVGALMAGIPDSVTAVTINRVCISGMEAVISNIKRGYNLNRCTWKGWEHFEAKVLWSVIAYNIRVMTGHLVKLA